MKIILAHKFHRYTGGAEVFYLEVGRILEEKGHEVAYFSTLDNDILPTPYSKYFVEAPKFKSTGILKSIVAFLRIPYNFKAKRKFGILIDDFKPDIIHVFGVITQISPSIFDVARNKKVPLVISLNDYKHICPNYKLFHHGKICEECKGGRYYKAVQNKCSHNSLKYSFASSLESYIHKWTNIYKKNISLFLFSSDFMLNKTKEFWGVNSFSAGMLRNPFNLPSRNLELNKGDYGLYFGRIIEEKGVIRIIEALKYTPEIPFKIIGDGPQLNEVLNLAKAYNLNNIEFLGAKWGIELEEILYKARFVVVPSVWHENFPYVILQSFAAAVPVIGSNLGGITELLNDGRGLLFDIENNETLTDCIKKIYSNKSLATEIGQKAYRYVLNNFNDEYIYQNLINHYNKLIE
jgi:glycosyltransferase involved in cell wall biosynthesis